MRIRKNAKISTFLIRDSNLSSSLNINNEGNLCQLNQSPWDIITFPSTHSSASTSLHQFDGFDSQYDVNLAANWSSVDSVGAIESVASINNSLECEFDNNVNVKDYELYEKEDNLGFIKGDEEMVLCGKTNGKGWQCGKIVKNGNLMCKNHLIEFHQNDAILATKNKKKPQPFSRSTKKRAVAITSNPNDYYYYSGFGPSWGKKRGELTIKCTTLNACDTTITNNSNVYETNGGGDDDGDVGVEEEQKKVEPDPTTITTLWSGEVGPVNEDLDYTYDEKDVGKEKVKKKRGRKPIKARSLKSLM